MNRIVILAAVMLGAGGAAPALADAPYNRCMDAARTDGAMGACGDAFITRADSALNASWRSLQRLLDAAAKPVVLDEQRAWLTYRDRSCAWLKANRGTMGPAVEYRRCRAAVIEARTAALNDYIEDLSGGGG